MALPLPEVDERTRRAFRRSLVAWYERHQRRLPWRETKDPYAITVSEFMLQQTQVATVIPYYERWLQQFPDWTALAATTEEEVIKAWEGLGYYRRVRTLRKLAQTVVDLPGKELPASLGELQSLPGIGPYTSRAIGSISLGLWGAVLDGNVMRVLARVFALNWDIAKPATMKQMQSLADQLAPIKSDACGDYNQAIMELGALICTPRSPQCLLCPLQSVCQAPEPEALPIKTRVKTEEIEEKVAVLSREMRGETQWWLERPPEGQRLDALWRFPHYDEKTMSVTQEKPLAKFTYGITKYRVKLQAVAAVWSKKAPTERARQGWKTAEEIEELALASAHRKVWGKLAP